MDIHQLLVIFHIIFTAIGVGGATISDILFFRSVRDEKISSEELGVLNTVSKVVQIGFIGLLLTGSGFLLSFISESGLKDFVLSDKVNAKITIVTIIFLNSLILHFIVLPLFKKYKDADFASVLRQHRIPIFTSGAISAVSWYSALILGAWRGLNVPYTTIISIYVLIILGAVITANLFGITFISILRKKTLMQQEEERPLPPHQ